MRVLDGLSQDKFFYFFEEICNIPRGSENTEAISSYCENFAKERGLRYIRDEAGNIIVFKSAAKGYENCQPVMIQGHLDMVCEKNSGSLHDFEKEPLSLFIDGDEIGAKETTLGADDGIAIAYMLSILDDTTLEHPALECVMTTSEETGMNGADFIDLSECKSERMINIDSEKDGIIMAGCAGGVTVTASLPLEKKDILHSENKEKYIISVDGLCGGHSGDEIDKQRANAPRIMARLLFEMQKKGVDFDLISLNGGSKENAIPRRAEAIIVSGEKSEKISGIIREIMDVYNEEFKISDSGMNADMSSIKSDDNMVLTPECFRKICMLLIAAPDGVQKMSLTMENLVQTSLNTGIVTTGKDFFEVHYLIRSSVESEKEELKDRLLLIADSVGADASLSGDYPGWEYKPESDLQKIMIREWRNLTGKEPEVRAIHAGLECGFFIKKKHNLDVVSIGPQMRGIHTPEERLSISSSLLNYDFIKAVLKSMNGQS